MTNTNNIYRSPPNCYHSMSLFNLVKDFIDSPSTCSSEVVNLIKEKLNIQGRKITFFNKKSSELAGIKPEYINDILNMNDTITIIVSPPIIGKWSDNPFWHRYEISNNGDIKHKFAFE